MAEGVVLKWLSYYRINKQREHREGRTAQRQLIHFFTLNVSCLWLRVQKVHILLDFEVPTVDCDKVAVSCDCCAKHLYAGM